MGTQGRLTIAGSIAQKPHQAGHSWQFLQYLLGFRRLGWDVLFVDRLEGDLCRDAAGRAGSARKSVGLRYLEDLMKRFGLADAWSLAHDDGSHAGVSREGVLRHVRESELLLNVMGFLTDEEILGAARRRVFLDTDPGFGQMWLALGLADVFAGHEHHVTIGERIGRDDCTIPECGLAWVTTPQPVVLEEWPAASAPTRDDFTTVARWRGAYGPVDYDGRRYGLRVHEFRKFAALPRATAARFELALDIHPAETADLDLLDDGGWALVDPAEVGDTADSYRAYIGGSAAEFMVAKGMYVESRSGWFSERSICYLATGRPVLAQDTGLGDLYPVGEGLVAFSTLEEAVGGVEEIRANYARHARAAREIAEAHFDSDKVLGRLVEHLAAA
jgi:hypothetical protein